MSVSPGFGTLKKTKVVLNAVEADSTKWLSLQCYVYAIFFKQDRNIPHFKGIWLLDASFKAFASEKS